MRFDIISLFPQMFDALDSGIPGRAQKKDLLKLRCWNPRDYTSDVHRTVDDRPYGGGPGMVMMYQPLADTLTAIRAQQGHAPVVCLSPQGRRLDQKMVQRFAQQANMVLVCGRYEGIDERFMRHFVDEEVSIGDYVLSGGELPAMTLIDAVTRMLPEALGDAESAEQDSFMNGLLDCPHYTRPETVAESKVPAVLLGGHHEKIKRWRLQQALRRTQERRLDLLQQKQLSELEQTLLNDQSTAD